MARRLVVIGGDAAGMSAASQARRDDPSLDIIALEKGQWTSYAACGIPYHVAGDIGSLDDLVARTPEEFRSKQRIDVRTRHEAMAVDTDAGTVEVRDHGHNRTITLGYDDLLIATGAVPLRPDIPGIRGESVLGVQTLADAHTLVQQAKESRCRRVLVVGGGYIGLEMAEAFIRRGAEVTVVDAAPAVMGTLDPDMGALVREAMEHHGIEVRCDTPVAAFEPGACHTEDGATIDADLVVLGMGVGPNAALAAEAGIPLGAGGAVGVDRTQRSGTDGVWAAGDCADVHHRVTDERVHVALGTVANRTGRVAGVNLGGGYATFPGVVGTAITKLCATEIARTGLTSREADAAGFGYAAVRIESRTRAGYFPGADPMTVKLLAERGSGRVLGVQIVGGDGAAKRIDTAAAAVTAEMTVQDLVDLDTAYAPPFSPVWDPLQTAARRALKQV